MMVCHHFETSLIDLTKQLDAIIDNYSYLGSSQKTPFLYQQSEQEGKYCYCISLKIHYITAQDGLVFFESMTHYWRSRYKNTFLIKVCHCLFVTCYSNYYLAIDCKMNNLRSFSKDFLYFSFPFNFINLIPISIWMTVFVFVLSVGHFSV